MQFDLFGLETKRKMGSGSARAQQQSEGGAKQGQSKKRTEMSGQWMDAVRWVGVCDSLKVGVIIADG